MRETWTAIFKRIKLNYFLTYTNSKLIKELNERPETNKQPLEVNIGSTHFDFGLGNVFWCRTWAKQPKTNQKMWLHQTEKLLHKKESISKIKRQPTKWDKIFANSIFYNELIFKIYKELIQLNIKKPNDPIKKWVEDMKRHTAGQESQERWSTSWIIREIKTTRT